MNRTGGLLSRSALASGGGHDYDLAVILSFSLSFHLFRQLAENLKRESIIVIVFPQLSMIESRRTRRGGW